MDLHLQPLSAQCAVTGREFEPGDRVVSYLVREANAGMVRKDVAAEADETFQPAGTVLCRWNHPFKPRPPADNPGRELRMTAEALFVQLCAPDTELDPQSQGMIQFLALVLERKRVLKLRGRTPDGARYRYEMTRTKQMYEVPVGDLTPEFFHGIHDQIGVLVGGAAAAAPQARKPNDEFGERAED